MNIIAHNISIDITDELQLNVRVNMPPAIQTALKEQIHENTQLEESRSRTLHAILSLDRRIWEGEGKELARMLIHELIHHPCGLETRIESLREGQRSCRLYDIKELHNAGMFEPNFERIIEIINKAPDGWSDHSEILEVKSPKSYVKLWRISMLKRNNQVMSIIKSESHTYRPIEKNITIDLIPVLHALVLAGN